MSFSNWNITPPATFLRRRALPVLAGFIICTILQSNTFAQNPQTQADISITVREVLVEGNLQSDPNLIIISSGLAAGNSYGLAEFQDVITRAVKQLWMLGLFSDVQIEGEQISGTDEVNLFIKVVERPYLNTLTFIGNRKLKRKDLLDASRLREGIPLGPSRVAQAIERIELKYKEDGYLRSEIETNLIPVDGDSTRVNLLVSIVEGPKVGINRIVILGNEVLSDRQIRRVMQTGTGFLFFSRGNYDHNVVDNDKELIAQLYGIAGYLDAEVMADSLSYDEKGKNMTLFLMVEEGPLYTLRNVTWSGIELLEQTDVDAVVTINPPEPYNEMELANSIAMVQGLYFEKGYVYANINPMPSYDSTFVDIEMVVTEGEPAYVAHIFITGNTRTKEHVIRRELLLKPGFLFSRNLFERSLREVMALNYFSNVELDPPPTPTIDGNLDVTIKVTERPTGQAMFGAGWSERDGLIGNIGLQLPNLFGNGQQFDFTWDFGTIRRTIQVGFTEPWLFNTPTLVGFNVYRTQLFYNVYYKQKHEGISFRIGRRLKWPDDYFRTSIGYRIEDTTFYDFATSYNPSEAFDLRRYNWPLRNSSLSWTISRDSRDRPEFPSSGSVNSSRFEIAGGPFGGDEQYVKWDMSQSFFFPFWANMIMNMRLKTGVVEIFDGWGREGFAPFNVKYLPGGTSFDGQIRGYENRRVGPQDFDGLEVGGQSLLIFTLECTFPIAPQQSIYGLVFADAGNSWLDMGDTDPFDLRRSIGFGLRMFTPLIGLIGFDFAYGFDHFKDGLRKGRWIPHFQFGTQFY